MQLVPWFESDQRERKSILNKLNNEHFWQKISKDTKEWSWFNICGKSTAAPDFFNDNVFIFCVMLIRVAVHISCLRLVYLVDAIPTEMCQRKNSFPKLVKSKKIADSIQWLI